MLPVLHHAQRLLHAVALLAVALPAMAADRSNLVTTENVRAEMLVHAPDGVGPGKPMWLGLAIDHQPEWHTYWKNPGDSGLPTSLAWTLPQGVSAGSIEWPAPHKLPVGPLVNYGYEGHLLLPVPVSVSEQFTGTAIDVVVRGDWLVCRESCIPEFGEFRLRLPVGDVPIKAHAGRFEQAFAKRPSVLDAAQARSTVEGSMLAVQVAGLPAALHGRPVEFFAGDAGVIDHAGKVEQRWEGATLHMRVPVSAQRSESPQRMEALLAHAGTAVEIRFPVVGGWSGQGAQAAAAEPGSVPNEAAASFALAIALAFAGGLLLNLMPCVFPVLSLKVFGFARHADDRRMLALGGVAYTLGVVASFALLAGLLLALRATGSQLGWGFQLQSPGFVAALALLFTLIGLNLLGVFEVRNFLPAGIGGLQAKHPVVDHALTGVLAVAVASPCTAPFMGVALGAALTLPPAQALAVFVALGGGMAAPYLAATLWPGIGRLLPRPGPWMVRFKQFMAIPMFATVAWLAWVLAQQLGPSAAPEPAGSRWQAWSAQSLAKARSEGRPVFVDFTAAWCVTCQYNKRTTLTDEKLLAELDAKRVVFLRADWTRQDPAISQELTRLGRSGVPVYALYAPGQSQPRLLSEILSAAEIREATAGWPARGSSTF